MKLPHIFLSFRAKLACLSREIFDLFSRPCCLILCSNSPYL